jgi:hypothetical protein
MIGNKLDAEAADDWLTPVVVDERPAPRRSHTVRSGGARGSENAGMSNDKAGENPARRKPKVSWGR